MKHQARRGFTIIEVMLFLAITGLLAIGVLASSNNTLGQQRYRDSVNSFKGFLQEQYSEAINVVNSNSENPICSKQGNKITLHDVNTQARGTSQCIILGKYLLVEETRVTSFSVIGYSDTETTAVSDTDALQDYLLAVASPETVEIGWGARLVRPKSTNGIKTEVIILRSPLSGSIVTYIKDITGPQIIDLDDVSISDDLIDDNNKKEKAFCVDSQGTSGMGRRQAVRIMADASSQSAIEIPLEKENVCD
jgi:type II secretory pathway pseudopilin PulG